MNSTGRHRDLRRTHGFGLGRLRRWGLRAALGGTAASIGLVATGAVLSPAAADGPLKVAWWNAAAASGTAAPAPDAPAGGMRVAVVPNQGIVSFGAVEYALPADGSGTLTLAVTQSTPAPPQPPGGVASLSPLGSILACPTLSDSWKGGDDQDISTAPKYDCNTFHFVGAWSDDGKSLRFLIDGAADVTPGMASLAIVPSRTTAIYTVGTDAGMDVTPPYYVDFDKPAATSLEADTGYGDAPSDSSNPPPPPPATTGGSGSGSVPTTAGSSNVPAVSLPTTTGTTDAGQAPVVASTTGTTGSTGYGAAPAAAIKPTGTSEDRRDLLLVLLILLLFAILYTQQNAIARRPRVIAGPGAAQTDATQAAVLPADAATAGALAAYLPFLPARGLGRFAKPRTGPARPLI